MPNPPLPTPQVQALSDDQVRSILRVEAGYCVVDNWVRALALEVLAHRARRCGGCLFWVPEDGYPGVGVCGNSRNSVVDCPMTWSCADFQPKEPK